MSKNSRQYHLSSWFRNADEYYKSSLILNNPMTVVRSKVFTQSAGWFILHHSIELHIKGYLINHNISIPKTHDLSKLVKSLKGLNSEVDLELARVHDNRSIEQWIYFINPFGFPNGGIKYLQKSSGMYAAPVGIGIFFSSFLIKIKETIDMDKNITQIIEEL